LFDLKYNSGRTSPSPYSPSSIVETDSLLSPRYSRYSREGSSSRDSGLDPTQSSLRTASSSRPEARSGLPSRPTLSAGGRSNTQTELLRQSPLGNLGTGSRYSAASEEERFNAAGSLKDRKRDGSDWRRISVPERGKDFNSLPRKYTRLSSLGMGWDRDPELSELSSIRSGRTSPSPRYSSYTSYSPSSLPPSSSTSSAYRRNSTIDLPIIRQTSTHELPPPSIRRSSTLDRPRDYSASRAGSVVRSTEPENRAMSPSYSRYTSTLDDTGDWGFSTLRRRNSRQSGSRPSFPNDDIRF